MEGERGAACSLMLHTLSASSGVQSDISLIISWLRAPHIHRGECFHLSAADSQSDI